MNKRHFVTPSMPSTTALSVLLVEDDLVFQETFVRVFALLGGDWEIQACPDGASALQALAEPDCRYNLALIDIGLPDMSGIEVIAAARLRLADLPIMVTTAFTAEETFFRLYVPGRMVICSRATRRRRWRIRLTK